MEKSELPSGYLGAGSHLPPNRKCLGAGSASGAPGSSRRVPGVPGATRRHTHSDCPQLIQETKPHCVSTAARGLHWGNLDSADKRERDYLEALH